MVNVQRFLPVLVSTAQNVPSHEPAYTVSPTTTGEAVMESAVGRNHDGVRDFTVNGRIPVHWSGTEDECWTS
jgi:hypothetical protein